MELDLQCQSDVAPGLLTIYSLRDILARWSAETQKQDVAEQDDTGQDDRGQDHAGQENVQPRLPVVYPDHTLEQLLNALESLAVISSESLQFQIFAAVVQTLAQRFGQLPATAQQHAEMTIRRLLSALGDHVLTTELDQALATLIAALYAADCTETAAAVQQAQADLQRSLGTLHSRATRAGWGWASEALLKERKQ
ncbi:MAG: hypothetical protein R2867_18960 [Caldilineaceae bacterium]